jgi:hypothetical protein
MAGVLFAPTTRGPSVLFRIGSLSTSSNRWSRCPGAGAIKLKEALSPSPLRKAPNKEPPGRGSEEASALLILAIPNVSQTLELLALLCPHLSQPLPRCCKQKAKETFERAYKGSFKIPSACSIGFQSSSMLFIECRLLYFQ